jgi:hypothetical protein
MNGNGPEPAPTPAQRTYDGNIQVPVTLNLANWGVVLNMLAEAPAPWKTSDALMKAINEQIQATLQKIDQPVDPPQPGQTA